jgi:hypothetical protein
VDLQIGPLPAADGQALVVGAQRHDELRVARVAQDEVRRAFAFGREPGGDLRGRGLAECDVGHRHPRG